MLVAGASCAGTIRRAVTPYHPVQPVGQSSEVVLGLPSHSIPSLPVTCLRPCLSITSLAGTPLGYDTGPLLMSEADSEAVFGTDYWSPASHSSIGSACHQVSSPVFRHPRRIPVHFRLLPRHHRLWKVS